MSKHIYIYIPGLGDTNLDNRRKLLSLWSIRRTTVLLCGMNWGVREPWPNKLARITSLVAQQARKGHTITVIGESAGASAAITAFSQQQANIRAVILLCGKSQHPESMSAQLIEQYPALLAAVKDSSETIANLTDKQKLKILNLHPLFDPVVPIAETKIPGVKEARMPIIGHASAIVFANVFWMWRIVRFTKKLR